MNSFFVFIPKAVSIVLLNSEIKRKCSGAKKRNKNLLGVKKFKKSCEGQKRKTKPIIY